MNSLPLIAIERAIDRRHHLVYFEATAEELGNATGLGGRIFNHAAITDRKASETSPIRDELTHLLQVLLIERGGCVCRFGSGLRALAAATQHLGLRRNHFADVALHEEDAVV